MNRGSDGWVDITGTYGVASMRPRFMNRGSSHARAASIRNNHASMRPRFMNRGSLNLQVLADGEPSKLQ